MPEYIDREALIARYDEEHIGAPGRARQLMVEAPACNVAEVKHGKWVETERVIEGEKHIYTACSLCGASQVAGLGLAKYCYECGAKMDGSTETSLSNGLAKADELANGLTDDEVIKSLEICSNYGDCRDCKINPHKMDYGCCTSLAIEAALALINRLKAEIKRLKEYEDIRPTGCPNCHRGNFSNSKFCSHCGTQLQGKKKDVKAEAIREFADRLKGHRNGDFIFVSTKLLDNLVKEMAGDTDER